MKYAFLFLVIVIVSCNSVSNSGKDTPSDSTLINILMERYTAGNKNDGAEFVTVDTLYILSKEPAENGACNVKYHVKVHYTAPAMGPGYERADRPGMEVDSVEVVE